MTAFGISRGTRRSRERVDYERETRLGFTRKNPRVHVFGVPVKRILAGPEFRRERWLRIPDEATYHAAVIRLTVEDDNGARWIVLQGRVFNATDGYLVSITGLYSIKPA